MSFPIEKKNETVPPTSSKENICFYCTKISEVFCNGCQVNTGLSGHFCQECSKKTHKIFDNNQKHNPQLIKVLGIVPTGIENAIEIPKKCSKHDKKFSSYCFDCNKLICTKGLLEKHKLHNIELIEDAIVKIDINKLVETKNLKQTMHEKKQSIQTIEKKFQEIEKQKKKLIQEISNKGKHLIDKINEKMNEIINLVNNDSNGHILMYKEQIQKEKKEKKLLKTSKSYIPRLEVLVNEKNSNPLEILYFYSRVSKVKAITEKKEKNLERENKKKNTKKKKNKKKKNENENESESDFKIDDELCLPIMKQLRTIQDLSLQKQIELSNYVIRVKEEYQLGETVSVRIQLKQKSINYKNFLKEVDMELCIKINEKNIIQLNDFKYKPSITVGIYECNFKPSQIGNYKITILRFGSQEIIPQGIGFKISRHSKKCFNPERCGQYFKLSNNNKTIKNVGGNGTTWFTNQVEGINIMKRDVHFYKFKIDHKTSNSFHIGVKEPNKNVKVSKDGWAYDIHMPSKFSHGFPEKWGQKCRTGDIVTMKVDMDNKTLSYKRNDDDLGVAFKDLPKKCVLAVCIYAEDQQLTIL
ncbi:spry domain containing socs box protein [Anaeramoeba flamelloides]|uniref:Spry domain containing socs box protein n=1 Tax=Anaeramoeba flamelloides TaxID=1746091 RepID=A0ABQ8YP73_9EUKA|nr:spry domain containing socs box protein [Anaeramoeba flamelloides]